MAVSQKKSIGGSLLSQGLITNEQLEQAELEVREGQASLREVLIKKGVISEEDLATFMSQQLDIPLIDLNNYLINPQIIDLVPEDLARKRSLIPILKIGDDLTIAMVDPSDVFAIDELHIKTGLNIEPVLGKETEIKKALDQYYGAKGSLEEVIASLDRERLDIKPGHEPELKKLQGIIEETPVIKLVNIMIVDAARQGSSDIHIEPEEESLRIRFRIDGLLRERTAPPKYLQSAIISRIKVMADMDIAERRVPQDGRIQIKMEDRDIDIRVSCVPTSFGENLVLRLLDRSQVILELKHLGFTSTVLTQYDKLICAPHGIILVCGPTGSGKTTTLYASLNSINTVDKNIITIEDPVEYHLEGIRQMQVNPEVGLGFAEALSAILRQDPDIVMVGEIRNVETAKAAVQAALTGHLVFSTLHTNDAPGAITRLLDMGVEPFLISSSVIGVLSQRLVRRNCRNCEQKGCSNCLRTGFKGRTGIHELLIPSEKIRALTITKASTEEIRKVAIEEGMQTLFQDGQNKVNDGSTTEEEIMRVTEEV